MPTNTPSREAHAPSGRSVPLRRRVRRAGTEGTRAQFVTKSFSRDDGTLYRPSIDTATGAFFCDCPDHRYRGSFCKHLRRAAAQLDLPNSEVANQNAQKQSPDAAITPLSQPDQFPTSGFQLPSSNDTDSMKRLFFDEHIVQLLPALPRVRAQFADGGDDEFVWCFALLCANAEKGRPDTQFQLVLPMVQRAGCLELACDIDRPYDSLVYTRGNKY